MIREVKEEVIPLKQRLIAGTVLILIAITFYVGNYLTPQSTNFWSLMRIWASVIFSTGLICYFGKFLEVYIKLGPHRLKVVRQPAPTTTIIWLLLVVIVSNYSFYIV